MTQEAFAEELAVTQGVVSAWERGEHAITAENYANLAELAAKHNLHLEALRFLERGGVSAELITRISHIAKESRSRRDAAYRQALIEAQVYYPDDALAQHRYATRAAEHALRLRRKKSK